MKNLFEFIISLSLVGAIFFGSIPNVLACGPFSVDPLFSYTKHGYYPVEKYVGDEPGIVPNTYGRISLFPFYRQLADSPLSKDEAEQVVRAIHKRIGIGEYYTGNEESVDENAPAEPDFFNQWMTARKKALESKAEIDTTKRVPEGYGYYSNCLEDAFRTATATLRSRVESHGANKFVIDWTMAQDAVFSNCGGDGEMPSRAPENSPAWLVRDRAYQIAAAHFYATKLPEARAAFEKIAADSQSPWKSTANFVAARTLIRESSFIDTDEDADGSKKRAKKELLARAETRLEQILSDSAMEPFHGSSARLLGLVKYRKDGPERQEELARILASTKVNPNIYNDLTDYIWLLDKPERQAYDLGYEIDSKAAQEKGIEYYDYKLKIRDLPSETRSGDLSDWLFTYQAEDGFGHALEKWQQTKKLHWFVSAYSRAQNDSPASEEMQTEAKRIGRTSPAFATVKFHQIRLLLESGRTIEARKLLLPVLADGFDRFPASTQNIFLAQRMIVSENLDEFLEFSQRKAPIFMWSADGNEAGDELAKGDELYIWKNRSMFDFDSVAFMNHKMPLEMLAKAAVNPKLPGHLRKFVVTAAWTRAFLLKDSQIETEMRPLMLAAAPKPTASFGQYQRAGSVAEREATGLLFVLSNPVLEPNVPPGTGRIESEPQSIDSFRGNWWCTDELNPYEKSEAAKMAPGFLNDAQNAAASKEQAQLRLLGNSATNLAQRTIEFAQSNPRHRLTPQLLHLAVRSTRYGCGDKNTGAFSKEAFDILRRKYPRSVWTKRTPYWFKGNGTE